jgi:TIR domain-containing protein/pentapeptide repeat protein
MAFSLRRASFERADLSHAILYQAILSDANFKEADFRFATVTRSDVENANFAGASFFETRFSDMDLSPAIGLDSVKHEGPSTIGLDTVYRSHGKIPESFLRGAGVPENFITYTKSLTGTAFDFYSCFISHSTKDQEFADRLHADLQSRGVRCWFAPHDVKGGRKIQEQIDEAIRLYDRLLLVLSEHSMNSEWVKTEIAHARQKELNEGRQVLFPIRLMSFEKIREWKCFDADMGKDSAREIREYFIPDFSNWKDHDSYQVAFERLVRDLKAVTAGPVERR